jgi:RimJ/RimL family protein N-acetyltransferase
LTRKRRPKNDSDVGPLTLASITADDVYAVAGWRYEPPYDFYNLEIPSRDNVASFLDTQRGYCRITNEAGELVGFCCFGSDAQVPGGDYQHPALDIGLGVRPDLTGRGRGIYYVNAVIAYAERMMPSERYRVTIACFNERAQRVWHKAGFRTVQKFHRDFDGVPFMILIREA